MMMQIVGSFAEFERAMLRERTRNGLNAARREGRIGGRRPKLKVHQEHEIVHLVSSGKKLLPMLHGFSVFIRQRSRAYSRVTNENAALSLRFRILNRVLHSIAP